MCRDLFSRWKQDASHRPKWTVSMKCTIPRKRRRIFPASVNDPFSFVCVTRPTFRVYLEGLLIKRGLRHCFFLFSLQDIGTYAFFLCNCDADSILCLNILHLHEHLNTAVPIIHRERVCIVFGCVITVTSVIAEVIVERRPAEFTTLRKM